MRSLFKKAQVAEYLIFFKFNEIFVRNITSIKQTLKFNNN